MSSQALQSKHDALLKRVDELDTECEQLRDQLLEAEGEKDELQGVIEDLETEKGKLSIDLDSKQVCYVCLHTRTHAHTHTRSCFHAAGDFRARTFFSFDYP